MALPTNKIKKIKLPGDVDGNKTYEIIPEKMQNSGYEAALPTLTADTTLATSTDLSNKMDKTNPTGTGSLSLNRLAGSTVGTNSVAIGYNTTASGEYSYAGGSYTIASGVLSHTEGYHATGSGLYSHVEGLYTTANHKSQHVFGEYNISDTNVATADTRGDYIEIVGNGTSTSARSNARTLDWSGNEYLAGNLRAAGLTDGTTTKTMTEVLAGGGASDYNDLTNAPITNATSSTVYENGKYYKALDTEGVAAFSNGQVLHITAAGNDNLTADITKTTEATAFLQSLPYTTISVSDTLGAEFLIEFSGDSGMYAFKDTSSGSPVYSIFVFSDNLYPIFATDSGSIDIGTGATSYVAGWQNLNSSNKFPWTTATLPSEGFTLTIRNNGLFHSDGWNGIFLGYDTEAKPGALARYEGGQLQDLLTEADVDKLQSELVLDGGMINLQELLIDSSHQTSYTMPSDVYTKLCDTTKPYILKLTGTYSGLTYNIYFKRDGVILQNNTINIELSNLTRDASFYFENAFYSSSLTKTLRYKDKGIVDIGDSGGNSGLEIVEVDASSGASFSIDPGKCYNFGTRGVSSAETITLTFNSNYTGEFILKVFAKDYDVTLSTNISSSILDVTTPLLPGVSVSGSNIVLTAGYVYLLSIMSGVVYGTYIDRDMITSATDMIIDSSGGLTFTPGSNADTFKFNNLTVYASGTNISSLLSGVAQNYTFTESDSNGKYKSYTQTLTITAPASIPAPTNLTISDNTLTWTAPSATGITISGYYLYDNNGWSTSVTTTSCNVGGASGTIYVSAKVNITFSNTTMGYSYGTEAYIVK